MGWNYLSIPKLRTVEVWEWINNFTAHFVMDVITYSCWDNPCRRNCYWWDIIATSNSMTLPWYKIARRTFNREEIIVFCCCLVMVYVTHMFQGSILLTILSCISKLLHILFGFHSHSKKVIAIEMSHTTKQLCCGDTRKRLFVIWSAVMELLSLAMAVSPGLE